MKSVDQRLTKKELLRRPEEYRRVSQAGRGILEKGLRLKIWPTKLEFSRLGLVVPKRIIPRAVARNRLKRCLRETYRLNKHQLQGRYDLVLSLTGSRAAEEPKISFHRTEKTVLSLLKKAGALDKK